MAYKIIKDAFGKVKHWYINENEFVFNCTNYEKDEYTGRCYRLEDSKCLRADCDGKLAKRRISAKEYSEMLEKCKAECAEPETEESNTVSFTFEELEEERKKVRSNDHTFLENTPPFRSNDPNGENSKNQDMIIRSDLDKKQAGDDKKSEEAKNAVEQIVHTFEEKTTQRKELAKIAGTSEGSIYRSKTIIEKGTPEQIERARKGGKNNSITAIANEIMSTNQETRI